MSIEARLHDGRILRFPDGTDTAVIQRTIKRLVGQEQSSAQPPTVGLPAPSTQPPATGVTSSSVPDIKMEDVFPSQQTTGQLETQGVPQQVMGVSGGQSALKPEGQEAPLASVVEPALTMASGAIAEPLAGLAGMAAGVLPGEEGQAAETVEKVRSALTYKPITKEGTESLKQVGEFLAPVGEFFEEAEKTLGDSVFKATKSPALAAAAATIPTAIVELLGAGAGKKLVGLNKAIKAKRRGGRIAHAIEEAAPSAEQLKTVAREVYSEIDNSGAVVKPRAYEALSTKVRQTLERKGLDPVNTPKAARAVKRFSQLEGQAVPVTQLDTLRQVAQKAAQTLEGGDAALGAEMIDIIDEFLDKAGTRVLDVPTGADKVNLGRKYKVARDLWGRARRSEVLEEAFEKARLSDNYEKTLRDQMRNILRNPKSRKRFRPDEQAAIRNVINKSVPGRIVDLLGMLGFNSGGLLGPIVGVGAGAALAGTPGALLVPLVGVVSRGLAKRLTDGKALFADQVIRAGRDAKKIIKAYEIHTPKSLRDANELSELLVTQDIDLSVIPNTDLAQEAKAIALQRRAGAGVGALAPQALNSEEDQ